MRYLKSFWPFGIFNFSSVLRLYPHPIPSLNFVSRPFLLACTEHSQQCSAYFNPRLWHICSYYSSQKTRHVPTQVRLVSTYDSHLDPNSSPRSCLEPCRPSRLNSMVVGGEMVRIDQSQHATHRSSFWRSTAQRCSRSADASINSISSTSCWPGQMASVAHTK
jgi:hypothetical protein